MNAQHRGQGRVAGWLARLNRAAAMPRHRRRSRLTAVSVRLNRLALPAIAGAVPWLTTMTAGAVR